MDVDGLMMTVKLVVETYWVQGEYCWVKAQYDIMGLNKYVLNNNYVCRQLLYMVCLCNKVR